MGSMFDNRKVLHGLPLPGDKVVFSRNVKSWFTNVNEDQDKLVIGQSYTVRKTELNSSSTYVWLEEFPNIFDESDPKDGRDQPFFNMSLFSWIPPPINFDALIGLDARSCIHLNRIYGVGIYFNGQRGFEGDPEIDIDYDSQDRVTKADWHKY